jgi:hypothetical protein
VTETQARATARLTTPDQWTITERRSLPLHKVVVDDDRGTVVYVSEQTGEVAVATSRRSRLLAMAGAIPHWLYLTPLRTQNALWRQVILWTSGLTCLLAVTGLVVGWLQSLRAIIGRRAVTLHRGWMKWHHVTGLAFGLSTLTWAFSGFLSMDPWAWASDDSDTEARIAAALSGGPIDLTRFPRLDGPEAATAGFTAIRAKEVELAWIQDTPHFVVLTGTGPATVLDAAAFHRRPPFRLESFLLRVAQAVPEASITDTRLQDTYDAYYYARNAPPLPGSRPLPVVRMTLSDNSWLYIDPSTGRLIRRVTERRRVERWLYNGLHSLDFPFWYQRQWLWRTGVIALLSGGLLLGLIGVVIAIRRFTPAKA